MPMFRIHHLSIAAALLIAAANAAADPVAPAAAGGSLRPAAASPDGLAIEAAPPAVAPDRLRIGLSDSDTRLELPWFVTAMADAVNQDKSLRETAQELSRGF